MLTRLLVAALAVMMHHTNALPHPQPLLYPTSSPSGSPSLSQDGATSKPPSITIKPPTRARPSHAPSKAPAAGAAPSQATPEPFSVGIEWAASSFLVVGFMAMIWAKYMHRKRLAKLRQDVDDKGDELKYELVRSVATSESLRGVVDEELGERKKREPSDQFEEEAEVMVVAEAVVEEEEKSQEIFNPLLHQFSHILPSPSQNLQVPNNSPRTTRTNTIDSQDDHAEKLASSSIESDLFFPLELNTDFEQESSIRTYSTTSGPPVVYSAKCSGLGCTRM